MLLCVCTLRLFLVWLLVLLKLFLEELVVILCMVGRLFTSMFMWLLAELGRAVIRCNYQTNIEYGIGMLEAARKCIDNRRSARKSFSMRVMMIGMGSFIIVCYAGSKISKLEQFIAKVNEPKEIYVENTENYERN